MRKFGFVVALLLLLTSSYSVEAAPAPQQELPNVAFVDGLVGHGQTYPLSCESRSASDLAGFWGVSVPEVGFFNNLPKSDNPEVGFVGSVYGTWGQTPPNPYGVHAKPVAALLQEYGLNAQARRGMTMVDLKTEIAAGRPVIVWVVGHVWQGVPIEYTANDGSTVIVAQYEHTMIAYGYDLAGVYLMDAGNASRNAYSYSVFEASWGVLGNMAVTAVGDIKIDPDAPLPEGEDGQYVVQPGDYLSKLAREWGVSWQDIAALNGLRYPYTIYPGQILYTGLSNSAPTAVPTAVAEPSATPEPTDEETPTATPTETAKPTSQPTATPKPTAVPTATPQPTQEDDNDSPAVYVVQSGDHLMQIARNLNLNWEEIAYVNGLTWPYILYPGQVLTLPGGADTPVSTPVPTSTVVPGTSPHSGETYVIQPGEYLYTLAQRFGVNWQALAAHNNIYYPYIVYPGQVIEIP